MAKILQFDHTKHPFEDVLVKRPKPRNRMAPLAPWEPLTVVDLFAGAGGSTSGIVRAIEPSGRKVNLVSVNHWATSCRTMKKNHPNALVFNASVEVVDPRYAVPGGRIDILVASPECFAAGTLVLTKRGLISIEKVAIGDMVLTHKHRWRKVIDTFASDGPRDLLSMRGHGFHDIRVTPDHKIFTSERALRWKNSNRSYETIYGCPEWTPAEDSLNKFATTPRKFPALPIPKIGKRSMNFDEKFWWMVGRWIGDGSLRIREKNSEITICCGKHEGDDLEKRLLSFQPGLESKRAGLNELRWRRRDVRTATLFETGHSELAAWLQANFGRLAHGKTIPAWALGMPKKHRSALLDGYLSADGHLDESRGYQVQTAATVSKKLSIGIKLLAESLGHRVGLHKRKPTNDVIEGRKVNVRSIYHLSWYLNAKHYTEQDDQDQSWHRIKSIKSAKKRERVYCINVEEDNSFVADGIVVHNCITYSPARGNKNPIREQSRSSAAFIYEWLANPHIYVETFLLENVSEWEQWGPLDENLRPIKNRQGEYFDSFLSELRKLGYAVDHRVLNAADYGDVTSRKRIFVMGRADGEQIVWPEQSHAEKPEKIRGRIVKRWRAAREIIDWNMPGTSIFNRAKGPHAPKTIVRMRAGFAKQLGILAGAYVEALNRFIPIAQDFQDACKAAEARWPGKNKAEAAARAQEKAEAMEIARERSIDAFIKPVGIYGRMEGNDVVSMILGQHGGATPRDAGTTPIPTITTKGAVAKFEGVISGESLVDGFTFPVNHGGGEERTRRYDEILGTFTTKRSDAKADPVMEAISFVSEQRGFYEKNVSYSAKQTHEPLSGITAHTNHHALVQGGLPNLEPEAFISHMRGYFGEERLERTASSTEIPLDTIAASGNHHAVVRAKIVNEDVSIVRPWIIIDGIPYSIDVLFRMLTNDELAKAMSFIDDNHNYDFAGSTQAITRQIGNAVPVQLSKALVGAQLRFYLDPLSRRRGRVARRFKSSEVAA